MRNTAAKQARAFGAKVTQQRRTDGKPLAGYYIYTGVNFTAKFNSAACETSYWEVDLWDDNASEVVINEFRQDNMFERKTDVLWALLCLDRDINTTKI